MSSIPVLNQCRLAIEVFKLYVHVRPPQGQFGPCPTAEEIEDVEVVEVRKLGDKYLALFRRSGEGVNRNNNWVDIDQLRLRLVGRPCV